MSMNCGSYKVQSLDSVQSSVGEIKGSVQGNLYITVAVCSILSGFPGSSAGIFLMQQHKQEAVILISSVFSVFESAWVNVSWLKRCTPKEYPADSVNQVTAHLFQAKRLVTDYISEFHYSVL